MPDEKAIAAIYLRSVAREHTVAAKRAADQYALSDERIDLGVGVEDLHRQRAWRLALRKQLELEGRKVLAINVLAQPKDGFHVAVTVREDNPARAARRKPVTRGGKPIEGPRRLRTRGQKQRSLR